MDETYRMLGREHEADLEREARKWQRAAEVRAAQRPAAATPDLLGRRKRLHLVLVRFVAFVGRAPRVDT
jgi:hypothetical protein